MQLKRTARAPRPSIAWPGRSRSWRRPSSSLPRWCSPWPGSAKKLPPTFGSEANGSIAFPSNGSTLKPCGGRRDRTPKGGWPEPSAGARIPRTFSPDGTRLAYRTTGDAGIHSSSRIPTVRNPSSSAAGGSAVAESCADREPAGRSPGRPTVNAWWFTQIVAADRRDYRRRSTPTEITPGRPWLSGSCRANPGHPPFPSWRGSARTAEWIGRTLNEGLGRVGRDQCHPSPMRRPTPSPPADVAGSTLDYVDSEAGRRIPRFIVLEYAAGEDVKIFDLATARETRVATGFWGIMVCRTVVRSPGGTPSPGIWARRTAGEGIRALPRSKDVLAGSPAQVVVFPDVDNLTCYSRVSASGICSPG